MVIFGPRAMRNTEREIRDNFPLGLYGPPLLTFKDGCKGDNPFESSYTVSCMKMTVRV